jgi:hypothetical protein
MLHTVSLWLAVAAFTGAGLFNIIAAASQQESFVRWGYPAWWGRVTGVLELAVAVLIAIPASSSVGLMLGSIIMAAAAMTVLRHRAFSHLAPISVFVALLVAAGITS